ncbi:MAG: hypothetical protein LBR08_11205 [Bacteroidales bacterium]|jgi:hypothetical protein|nr:hypothetical protein [Bacteroidales bacterium]
MKKWLNRIIAVIKDRNLLAKAKEGKLSADEQKQIWREYETRYGSTFQADREADEDDDEGTTNAGADDFLLSEQEQQELFQFLQDDETEGDDAPSVPKTGKEANNALKKKIVSQQKTIERLAVVPETDLPVATVTGRDNMQTMTFVMGHTPHTKTHLFGIDCAFMQRGKWWNEITANRKEVEIRDLGPDEIMSFRREFNMYSDALAKRSQTLASRNALAMLDYGKMIAGTAPFTEYTGLDAKFGEYTVRRQDIILAYFRSLPSVQSIFPVQSNVRNKEVVPTVSFGELSQGWRDGEIFKGNVKFAAEIYWVNDVMFKYRFNDMIALQKRYVMDLSKGSSPFQWTFIEWVIMYFGLQLNSELQRRRVTGVRVPQQNVVANPAMFAADGVLRAIERTEEELKVLPFEDMGAYTESTIVDYFETMWDKVDDILPNMDGVRLFANAKHKKWYLRNFREKYGDNTDFSGVRSDLIDVNPEQIQWVPNMPNNCFKIWITYPGNIENLEYVPNEMYAFKFHEGFEDVKVLSRWMEGAVVQKVGIQYPTRAELQASERKNQWLFTNFPASTLADGATTVDGHENTVFLTGSNAAATALTDIENASSEVIYKIICGSTTNATTIAKSGNFAGITAAWTPAAVGQFIKLYAELEDYTLVVDGQNVTATRATGKFLELSRG